MMRSWCVTDKAGYVGGVPDGRPTPGAAGANSGATGVSLSEAWQLVLHGVTRAGQDSGIGGDGGGEGGAGPGMDEGNKGECLTGFSPAADGGCQAPSGAGRLVAVM